MPAMGGWELLDRVTEIIESGIWSPDIYVVTSSVLAKDKEATSREEFLKQYILKPMRPNLMCSILEDYHHTMLQGDH